MSTEAAAARGPHIRHPRAFSFHSTRLCLLFCWIPERPIVVQSLSPLEFYQNVNMSIPTVFIVPPVERVRVRRSYLLGVEVNRDHEGGSSRARPHHCTAM